MVSPTCALNAGKRHLMSGDSRVFISFVKDLTVGQHRQPCAGGCGYDFIGKEYEGIEELWCNLCLEDCDHEVYR